MNTTSITSPKVLLAIPVYNEQRYLEEVLDAVKKYIADILVIDDGSSDDSKVILARRPDVCFISHFQNRGYGQSIIDALYFGRAHAFDWVITMDCDLQHEPERLPDFLAAIDGDDADVISGSRYLADCPDDSSPPPDRRHINKYITGLINDKLQLNITDAFCGFKACRVNKLAGLQLTETGYAFPLEFWVESARNQLRIREIPVSLIYNDPTRHFGGELDEAENRLAHYKEVFSQALNRMDH